MTEEETMLALGSAGNSGDEEVMQIAATFLNSKWYRVRAQAVLAIREGDFLTFESAFRQALNDKQIRVRRAAAQSLSAQSPSIELSRLLLEQIEVQTDSQLRVKLLRLIWANRKVNLEAESFVRVVSRTRNEIDLRTEAISLIGQNSE